MCCTLSAAAAPNPLKPAPITAILSVVEVNAVWVHFSILYRIFLSFFLFWLKGIKYFVHLAQQDSTQSGVVGEGLGRHLSTQGNTR